MLALAGIWAITAFAVFGPHPLPARIPTHFDLAGRPDGWGTPAMLWLLPIVATGIVGLMMLAARYPRSFNFPVRVTPANRPRLEAITLGMIAWLQLELAVLFLWIQYAIIESARAGRSGISPFLVPLSMVVIFATVGGHIWATFAAGRKR